MSTNSSISARLNGPGHWEEIWIFEWNNIIMIKQQNIFFDNSLDFNATGGGILENDTEILNLYFQDNCDSNSLCLIGNCLEWKPKIWMEFEQEKIKKLKEINIVCLMGDLIEFANHCEKILSCVKINYYNYCIFDSIQMIKDTLGRKHLPVETIRKNTVHSSVGTIRLNRYILVQEGIANGYHFYYPAISYNSSKDFEYQISRSLNTEIQPAKEFKENRMFGNNMGDNEFNAKQIKVLCESYINIVSTFPNTDWLKDKDDEKYFDTILSKTVPFMLCEKNSNLSGVELLGFLPYEGFNLKSDSHDNPVQRWKSLLEDNEHIFKEKKQAKELYDQNQRVIEHNYSRLVNTDWESERLSQFDRLPNFIKDYLTFLK